MEGIEWAERPTFAPPNILLYGPEGSGKTAGACSAPGVKLLFNNDLPNRTRFARSKRRDPQGLIKEPRVPRFVRDSGMNSVEASPTMNMMRWIMEVVSAPEPIPDVVITDPIDGLYRKLLEELSNMAIDPSRDYRRLLLTYIERYCLFLCEQPNVSAIFVCQEMEAEKGDVEGLVVRPYVGSKTASMSGLGPKIRRMVDIVGYCGVSRREDDTAEYGAQLISGGGRTGKDGFACLGEYQPLDLTEWWRIITEAEDAGSDVETARPEPVPDPTPASPPASTSSESTTPAGGQDSADSGSKSTEPSPTSKARRSGKAKAA